MDQVFLKRDIKKDKAFENHPNLIFGLCIIPIILLIVASIWCYAFLNVPGVLIVIFDISIVIGMIIWFIKKNENTNLTKSSAFVLRDGILHYIRLGYGLDGDIPVSAMDMVVMGPLDAARAARADENIIKGAAVQEMRKKPETFSNYLTQILINLRNSPDSIRLPEFVIQYCPMMDAKLEKIDDKWIRISYINQWTGGKRATAKYRNVYDSLPEYFRETGKLGEGK